VTPPSRSSYSAVSIVSKGGRCGAAAELDEQRFLSEEAPPIPLPDCDQRDRCQCRYQHWDDRRQDDRRSPLQGMAASLRTSDDRRDGDDRRD